LNATLNFLGRPNSVLFNQPRYLISGLDINMKLQRNNADFVLRTTEENEIDWKIKIISAELFVRKVCVHPSILTSHMALLNQRKKILCPIHQTDT